MSDLYGLIGGELGHSISPQIHSYIAGVMGMEVDYRLFEVKPENAGNIVTALKTLEVRGANVTMPYKVEVIPQLARLSPEAEAIGAVNTVAFENGVAVGHNTDYYGLVKTFERMNLDLKGKFAVVMGNGGASKAVQALLLQAGIAEMTIVTIEDDWYPNFDHLKRISDQDILINATPVGMYPHVDGCLVDEEILSKFNYALDVIYNPLETRFLELAKKQGLVTENGLCMVVYQAIRSQEIWNGFSMSEAEASAVYERAKQLFQ